MPCSIASNGRSSATAVGDGRQDVVDVRPADELRSHVQRAARRPDVERQAVERERQRPRRDVGRLIDRVRDGPCRHLDERGAVRIVEVDQAGASGGSISNSRRFAWKYVSMSTWKSR